MLSKLRYITSWNITLFFNVLGTSVLGHGGVIGTRFTLLSKTGRKQDTIVKITIFRHCTESSVRLRRESKAYNFLTLLFGSNFIAGSGDPEAVGHLANLSRNEYTGPNTREDVLTWKGRVPEIYKRVTLAEY